MEASAVPREAPAGLAGLMPHRMLRLASDALLVSLIRQGRPGAFEIAYNRHHRGILTFCRHMLGDAQEAEDVVQQTFLAAYNDLISSEKPIHLRAWLFTIARNRCYSLLRARREQPLPELEELATEGLAVQVQRRQDLRDLVRDMRSLPPDQRAALVLAELDALSHEQIAEVLEVPRGKVKALVFQARESLMASRIARETDCAEIRAELATGRGAALRRTNLRRHLRDCAGCRDFRRQVERQRRRIALILPVGPTIAMKELVIAGAIGGGVGGGGLTASTLLKSSLAKGVAGLMLAGVSAAGTIVAAGAPDVHLRGGPQPLHRLSTVAPGTLAAGASSQRLALVRRAAMQAPESLGTLGTLGTDGTRLTIRVPAAVSPRSLNPSGATAVLRQAPVRGLSVTGSHPVLAGVVQPSARTRDLSPAQGIGDGLARDPGVARPSPGNAPQTQGPPPAQTPAAPGTSAGAQPPASSKTPATAQTPTTAETPTTAQPSTTPEQAPASPSPSEPYVPPRGTRAAADLAPGQPAPGQDLRALRRG